MFGLLYNAYKYFKTKSERKVTIALLGIDNSGKTTILNTIQGELDTDTSPTFGFNSSTVIEGKYKIEVFDLGGGKNIRSVWKKYLAEVHGIVYVVDAADPQRFEESKQTFHDALSSPYLADKPILVFANKQDLPAAAPAATIVESLGLAAVTGNSYNVFPCSAKPPPGQPPDPRLREGWKWLTSSVDKLYSSLNPRVQREAEEVRAEETRKKKEREEKLRQRREERLRQQQEEEQRANEKENELHDGKPAAGSAALAAIATAGLPNHIESPGKTPLPPGLPLPDSDLTGIVPDQGASALDLAAPAHRAGSLAPLPPLGPSAMQIQQHQHMTHTISVGGTPPDTASCNSGSALMHGAINSSSPMAADDATAGNSSGGGGLPPRAPTGHALSQQSSRQQRGSFQHLAYAEAEDSGGSDAAGNHNRKGSFNVGHGNKVVPVLEQPQQ